jgi:epidermal growth factor receptor substrate 15
VIAQTALHANTASSIAGSLVTGRVASATFAASVDWGGVTNKPTSIASATISSSAIISSSATIATTSTSATISASSTWSSSSNYSINSGSSNYATTALTAINGGSASIVNASVGNYGSFYSSQTQTNPTANVRMGMNLDYTVASNGVSLSTSSTILVTNAGVYNIQFSAQIDKTDGGVDNIDIWLYKNGQDVDWSNTTLEVAAGGELVAAWNFLVSANAADQFSIMWSSPDIKIRLLAASAQTTPTRPAIPSVIVTVQQVTYGVQIASVSYATVSASSTISSSATIANHANTASAIAGSLVLGRVASATFAASVDWGGVTNKPTSIASATISSSAIISSSATVSASLSSSPSLSGVIILNGVNILSSALDTKTNNYTLTAGDGGNTILMNVASANLIVIPASATINFPIGTRVDVVQIGASATTASRASTDVTLNFYSPSASANPIIRARYGAMSLIKYDVNTWIAIGNIV